jgi:hypothetical protein
MMFLWFLILAQQKKMPRWTNCVHSRTNKNVARRQKQPGIQAKHAMTDSENSTMELRSSEEEPDTEDEAFLCPSDEEEDSVESDEEDEVAALRKDRAYQDVDRIQAQQAAAQAAAGGARRSGRKRKGCPPDRYQDPHFRSLMTDNNKDVLSSESEPEEEDDDEEEFSPLQGGEYSLDEASSDDASSEDE